MKKGVVFMPGTERLCSGADFTKETHVATPVDSCMKRVSVS